jgi:hypothetical protein
MYMFFLSACILVFRRKQVLPATTDIIFYRTKVASIYVIFSNLNIRGKILNNL